LVPPLAWSASVESSELQPSVNAETRAAARWGMGDRAMGTAECTPPIGVVKNHAFIDGNNL
jgi:hypothetical protein